MRRIHLSFLEIEGFRSFVQKTRIDFDSSNGLCMISGRNDVEPRLGGNGAGKSTIWDALCWCWFNSSVRNLRAAELTSWGSEKTPRVACGLRINDNEIVIERCGSPNRLLLDGELFEQEKLEREILGLSKARFLHSVLFGQLVRLFVDLSVPERGGLLDEVLDLGFWIRAATTAAEECGALTSKISATEKDLAYQQGKLAGLLDEAALIAQETLWENARLTKTEKLLAELEAAETTLSVLQAELIAKSAAVALLPPRRLPENIAAHERMVTEAQKKLAVAISDKQRIRKEAAFFAESPSNCPTCAQEISKRFAADKVKTFEFLMEDLEKERVFLQKELDTAIAQLSSMRRVDAKQSEEREVVFREERETKLKLKGQQQLVDALAKQAEAAADEANPFTQQRKENASTRNALQRGIAKTRLQAGTLREEFTLADYWKTGFKKVRLFQVAQSLDMLQLEVNSAAAMLGLTGWTIQFVTEVETKAGTVRQGVRIVVSSPTATGTWESWSGGEGQRIRLAVAMGLAALIQRMAGVHYDFEVWDEPSAWLSPEGINDLLGCLDVRAKLTGKTVWILDHRALWHAGFAQTWEVSKTDNGSTIKRTH